MVEPAHRNRSRPATVAAAVAGGRAGRLVAPPGAAPAGPTADRADRPGLPPEPAHPPRRRPPGGGRLGPGLVEQHERCCGPGSGTRRGDWQLVGEPVPARVGRNGFVLADRRRQNSGTSPAGTFAVVSALRQRPRPGHGAGLPGGRPQRLVDLRPAGPAAPTTCSSPAGWPPVRWRRSWAEDLSGYGAQYRYAAVLGLQPADRCAPGAGRPAGGRPARGHPAGRRDLPARERAGRDRGLRVRARGRRCAGSCSGWTRRRARAGDGTAGSALSRL